MSSKELDELFDRRGRHAALKRRADDIVAQLSERQKEALLRQIGFTEELFEYSRRQHAEQESAFEQMFLNTEYHRWLAMQALDHEIFKKGFDHLRQSAPKRAREYMDFRLNQIAMTVARAEDDMKVRHEPDHYELAMSRAIESGRADWLRQHEREREHNRDRDIGIDR